MGDVDPLVERARQGDEQALAELFRLHLPGLRAFVRLQCGPALRARESVSDVVQSVCREVLEHLDGVDSGGAAGFKTWLYTTAMRKIRNRAAFWNAERRDTGREVAADGALLEAYRTLTTPSALAGANEMVARVESAFDHLEAEEREVILLARVVGLGHAEIALHLGKSEGACRVLLHRALARLSALLEAPAGG